MADMAGIKFLLRTAVNDVDQLVAARENQIELLHINLLILLEGLPYGSQFLVNSSKSFFF